MQDEREAKKDRRKKRKNDMESELADEVGEWEREERERKANNDAALAQWHAEVAG